MAIPSLLRSLYIPIGLCFLALTAVPVLADSTTTLPLAFATTEGDTNLNTVTNTAERTYQIQMGASQLGALSVGDTITGIAFRPDSLLGAASSSAISFTEWDLSLAQATNSVSAMSTDFASNMTNAVVVRSGALSLSSGYFSTTDNGSNPENFGATINFTQPYTYQGGDLIIYLHHTTGTGSNILLDATNSTASGYGTDYNAVSNINGTLAHTPVVITKLSYSSVAPEASTLLLALPALGIMGAIAYRRRSTT